MKISPSLIVSGAIIGKVNLVDVKKYDSDKEIYNDKKKHHSILDNTENKYGFILENPKKLRVPYSIFRKTKFL